jgi:TetR/AcrR family transcriptional repressor of nem operon
MNYPDRTVNIMTRRPNVAARERILRTAFELFAKGGFESVSMERVAARAGLKKANLFHYYPTKESLGVAVMDEAARRYADGVRAVFSDDEQDPVAAVRLLFARGAAGARRDCGDGCFIGRMAQDVDERNAELRRCVADCVRDWRAEIERFLGVWKKRGYFRGRFSPLEAADAVLALYEGALVIAKALDDPAPIEHAERAAVTVIVAWRG